MTTTDQDKAASIAVPDGENACWIGWPSIVDRLQRAITERCSSKPILVVECYPGVYTEPILRELQQRLKPALALPASIAFHAPKRIATLVQPYLDEAKSWRAGNHPLTLPEFFDAEQLWHARREIEDLREGLVVVVGCGASLIAWGHVLVYAGLTRVEARTQLCQQNSSNLGLENHALPSEEKLRIASHVEWPVTDRWKRPLITHWDFVLKITTVDRPALFDGEAVQRALQLASQRPFCFAPKSPEESAGPNPAEIDDQKSAWTEECLQLMLGATQLALPALDLLLAHPRELLGDVAFRRFGFNCPLPHWPRKLPASPHQPLHDRDGWKEGRIVLPPPFEAIELRRLQITRSIAQQTDGHLWMLELVDGPKLSVESPDRAFDPLTFQRGQTFVVPAAVGAFLLRPAGLSLDRPWVVLKACIKARRGPE